MRRNSELVAVKVVHTAVWAGIESCLAYVLYAGFTRRSDRRAALAAGIVTAEIAVFAGNGFRCPLTAVAEGLGADHGSVTDLFLPRPLAHALPALHVPLVALAVTLHARNLRAADRSSRPGARADVRIRGDRLAPQGDGSCLAAGMLAGPAGA